MPRIDTIQIRRGTAAAWLAANPVLLSGEQGLETDTNKVKIGDGITAWNALAYFAGSGGGATAYTDLSDKASAPIATVNTSVATALAALAPQVNPTFSGTVSGISKTAVGLANVDNVSDLSKPISNAQAAVNTATTSSLSGKQAALTAGSNITIVGSTISSSANAPTTTTFAQALTFDGYRTMGENTVASALTFTIDTTGARDDGETIMSLIANGTNTPSFAAYTLAGAQTYGTTAGQVNNISFFREFGRYYYGVMLGPINDVIAPTLVSDIVANASATHVDLVWSEPINSAISAAAAFTVSGHTVLAHTYVDSTHTYLTVSVAFTNGEAARTLNYAVPGTNPMKDLAVIPNLSLAITGRAITNNVASGAGFTDTFTRTSASTMGTSDSGAAWTTAAGVMGTDGTKGYVVTASTPALSWAETGLANATWQATLTGDGANEDYAAFVFRYVDISNYIAIESRGGGYSTGQSHGQVSVYKRVAGANTLISTGPNTGTYYTASNTSNTLKVITSGSTINLYIDGVFAEAITCTDHQTATKCAFFAFAPINQKIDNLTVA
jgi:hypothetical protein